MPRPLQVAIVGYGIGGIAAAIQLRRLGHRVTQFERNDPPRVPGGGMLLHPAALRQLRLLGVLQASMSCGALVRRIRARTLRGQLLMDLAYTDLVGDGCGLGIQRGVLHRLLSDADTGRDHVLAGHYITALDPQGGYIVQAPDRRHGPYDLIVAADGAHSRLRRQVPVVSRRDTRAEMAALVAVIDDPDRFAGEGLMQHFDGARHLSVWPVGRDVAGGISRCAVAMNVSLAEAETVQDRSRWRDHMTRLCPGIGTLLHRQAGELDLHVFRYRDVELGSYVFGRVVLLGDAAHSMSPQLGVGAQLAMEDAAVLAGTLALYGDVSAALRAYGVARPAQLRRHQQASRWLTPLFQSDSRLLAGVRDRVLSNGMPGPVIRRMAKALFC